MTDSPVRDKRPECRSNPDVNGNGPCRRKQLVHGPGSWSINGFPGSGTQAKQLTAVPLRAPTEALTTFNCFSIAAKINFLRSGVVWVSGFEALNYLAVRSHQKCGEVPLDLRRQAAPVSCVQRRVERSLVQGALD